jgi:hypothetical protein
MEQGSNSSRRGSQIQEGIVPTWNKGATVGEEGSQISTIITKKENFPKLKICNKQKLFLCI